MKKRIMSVLLCLAMVVGMLPTVAFATEGDTVKAIQLLDSSGYFSGISGPSTSYAVEDDYDNKYYTPRSYIYFGVNGNSEAPIKWRVLRTRYDNAMTSTKGTFLLSENVLNSYVSFDDSSSTYQGSNAQKWCSDFASNSNNFSEAEQDAMLGVETTDSTGTLYDTSWGASSLTTSDKLFFLSASELAEYVANYSGAETLIAKEASGTEQKWWLRSPDANAANNGVAMVGYVSESGSVGSGQVASEIAARPAMNLNREKVLFTSAAEDGKTADKTYGTLTEVETTGTNEWKLTIKDDDRESFTASASVEAVLTKEAGYTDWTVDINYSGAKTGDNEYVSAMLVNESNEVLYYGHIAENSGSGENVSVTIPDGLSAGTYTLKVFSEQSNGDKLTDYASKFNDITLTVAEKAHIHCVCGATHEVIGNHTEAQSIEWTAWKSNDSLPSAKGNYYLTGDVTLDGSNWEPAADTALCLNGHSITFVESSGDSVIYVSILKRDGTYFTLTDCVGTGKITHGDYVDGDYSFRWSGNGVFLNEGTFNMYGGEISGNKVWSNSNDDASYGSGVYLNTGTTFNMYGGEISDNILVNRTGKDIDIYGGGVYVQRTSTFNMYGGEISQNTVNNTGSGASYGGGVYADSNSTFTVSGNVKITGNTAGEDTNNVQLYPGDGTTSPAMIEIQEGLTDSARIGISTAVEDSVSFASGATDRELKYTEIFTSDKDGYTISCTDDGTLDIGEITVPHTDHCVCGAEHTDIGEHKAEKVETWTAWTSKNSLPTDDGYYYLTKNVTLTSAWEPVDGTYLCLNGKKITQSTDSVEVIKINEGVRLAITDCKESAGKITHTSGIKGRGIYNNKGTFTLWNGSITGNSNGSDGGGVYNYDGTFTMNGGSIEENTSGTSGGGGVYNSYGGFNIYGGRIANNSASFGGGVYNIGTLTMNSGSIEDNTGGGVKNDNMFTMNGGTISGNTKNGGVNNIGEFTMNGGTISDNVNDDDDFSGGGVCNNYGKFTMKDGTISGNYGEDTGGGVANRGTFEMYGGDISGNSCGVYGGGVHNFCNDSGRLATFTMTGGTISGNSSKYGGGVFNQSYGGTATFTMTGGTISGNNSVSSDELSGGGVFNMGTFNVSGTPVIKDNVLNGTKGTDGVYTGGTANNVYLYDTATITVTGDGMQKGAKVYVNGTNDGKILITGTTKSTGFYCDTEGLSFVSDGSSGLKLSVKTNEAQIDDETYETLEEALDAASENEGIDTIEIIGATVTEVTGATLKAGDSLKTKDSIDEYKATTDATLNVATDGTVTFTEGTVEVVAGGATVTGTAIAVGKSTVEITLPDGSTNAVTVTAGTNMDTVTVPASGKVKIGTMEYENASADAVMTLEVTKDGTNAKVTLTAGSLKLSDGASITGASGKAITNPIASSGDVITVTADNVNKKDGVTVAMGIGNAVTVEGKTYTNGSGTEDMVLEVTASGCVLTSGSAKLGGGASITGAIGKAITNPSSTGSGDDNVTVTASYLEAERKDTVTVAEGKTVKIEGITYTSGSNTVDMVLKVTASGVTLTDGALELSDGESITGASGHAVTNPTGSGNDKITVVADGEYSKDNVTVPTNGSVTIGSAVLTEVTSNNGINVTAGQIQVALEANTSVTIGGKTYTGLTGGGVVMVNPTGGEVTVTNNVSVSIAQSALTADFEYKLTANETITIGRYTYTAPEGITEGDVTIKGRGIEYNPTVVLKNAGGTVDVAKVSSDTAATTYTAVNKNTKFAMSENDADAKSIDLLGNGESSANSKIEIPSGVTVGSMSDPITSVADCTVISLDSNNKAVLEGGAAETTGTMYAVIKGKTRKFGTVAGNTVAYSVNVAYSTLSLNSGVTVTDQTNNDASGPQFTGAAFTFVSTPDDGTITGRLAGGASVTGKNVNGKTSTITGVNNENTEVKIYGDDKICLTGGKGQTSGIMDAKIGDVTWNFETNTGTKYTFGTADSTLTLNTEGSVEVDDLAVFGGKANVSFKLEKSDSAITAIIPDEAVVANGLNVTIKGVAKTGNGNDTKVEIGKSGTLTLVAGKGIAAGEETVKAKLQSGTIVEVTVPTGVSATIDLDDVPPTVKDLGDGESVTYGNVTYTAVTDSTFPLDGSKLTNTGEKAVVPAKTSAAITLVGGTNPVVTVLASNTGATTITKGTPSTVVLEKQNDKFTVGNQTYTASSDKAEFTVDENGNVTMMGGTATLVDGESIKGRGGKVITNPTNTGNDKIVVYVNQPAGKDTVTVPTSGGKVVIGGVEYEIDENDTKIEVGTDGYKLTEGAVKLDVNEEITVGSKKIKNVSEKTVTVKADEPEEGKNSVVVAACSKAEIGDVEYEAGNSGATFVIDKNGNVALASGEAVLDEGDSIIGAAGKAITNPTDSHGDKITVAADSTNNRDTVTVSASGGKVVIGGVEYEMNEDNTMIEVGTDGKKLTEGAVKLDTNEEITVGGNDKDVENTVVKNTGNEQIKVTANRRVTVPKGGQTDIGSSKITEVNQDTTFTIDKEGKVDVKLGVDETVTIDGVKYTGLKPSDTTVVVKDETTSDISEEVTDGLNESEKEAIESMASRAKVQGVTKAVTERMGELVKSSGISTTNVNKVDVDVNINVKLTATELSDKEQTMTYTATPVATVTTKDSDGNEIDRKENVAVSNNMLSGAMTVWLPLPEGFEPKQIKHTSSSDSSVEYFLRTSVSGAKIFTIEDNCAVFTITGFSTFELSGTVTYVAPSTGSSSISLTNAYTVSVDKTANGSVSASHKNASEGETVTVTITPDKGWTLEALTVLDKDGNEVKLTTVTVGEKYTFKMPSGKVEVKATFMEDNTILNYFVDVNAGDYFYDAVIWAAENGITKGVDDLRFAPNSTCTRAQIVSFLWRAAGSPEPKSVSSFSDVASDSYYAKAVAWAIENNITSGTGENRFSPDEICTRAQAVTFLARALDGQAAVSTAFSDVPADSWYAEAVAWAAENGVTEGIGGGLFGSDNYCTRGQIVTFLFRAYNK